MRGDDPGVGFVPGRGMWSGRLVPTLRDRAVGQETSAVVERPDGGLQISVETALAFNDLRLRQSVVASYDDALRPEWCRVDASINARALQIAVDVGARDAVVRVCCDGAEEERPMSLSGWPLLLPDNCFTLHALAAWSAACGRRPDQEEGPWTALPVGCDLKVSGPTARRVSLGGADLGSPSVTLHIAPDLDEHVWFVDNRIGRIAIPRLHVRVDRVAAGSLVGERACTTR